MSSLVAPAVPLEIHRGDACLFGGPGLLVHAVNDVGEWGAGFTRDIQKIHPRAHSGFLAWRCVYPGHNIVPLPGPTWAPMTRPFPAYQLGEVLLHGGSSGQPEVGYAHLCAQRGLPSRRNPSPGDLGALAMALTRLARLLPPPEQLPPGFCIQTVPLCCGHGGQSWLHVEPILRMALAGYPVRVYDKYR